MVAIGTLHELDFIYVFEILKESEEVRQPCSHSLAGMKGDVETHGRKKGRVRRTQVMYRSIQCPYLLLVRPFFGIPLFYPPLVLSIHLKLIHYPDNPPG